MSHLGAIQYVGADIDPRCVDMVRLNLRLYGIDPVRTLPTTLERLDDLRRIAGPMVPAYEAVLQATRYGTMVPHRYGACSRSARPTCRETCTKPSCQRCCHGCHVTWLGHDPHEALEAP